MRFPRQPLLIAIATGATAAAVIVSFATPIASARFARPAPQKEYDKDYLSPEEADQIRDAHTPSDRIKLYVSFADDRLKKFDYELNRTIPERNRSEILNSLLNGYAGSMDDGADQIAVAQEQEADIHQALKLMQAKGKEFLEALQKYDKDGTPGLDDYRDTLEDAIDGTKEDLGDVDQALKEAQTAPVRRKK
jgi:hypothetical protein